MTLASIVYFGFQALNGQFGLVGKAQIEKEIMRLELERDRLHAERVTLQRRVQLLSPDSLDPDLVDERARASLNLAHPNEVAIIIHREQAAKTTP